MAGMNLGGGTGSSMPMPSGLLPVGSSVLAGGSVMTGGTGVRPPVPSSFGGGGATAMAALRQQYDPLAWNDFFDSKEMVGAVPIYIAGTEGHVFVCLHGAGNSAMSFAVLAEQLKRTSTVVAFDWRGHGSHEREDETNMSQETLIQDTLEVLTYVH